jgi:hypothetical protein
MRVQPRSALDLHFARATVISRPAQHARVDPSRTDYEHLINGFDGAIMFWDHHFGRLCSIELGIADQTAIIVSADQRIIWRERVVCRARPRERTGASASAGRLLARDHGPASAEQRRRRALYNIAWV